MNGAAYFDRLYQSDPDPWKFASSAYERDKYTATLDALDGRRSANALEIGCSIGVFTHRLAAHCDALLAVDISAPPLRRARRLCRDQTHVRFRQLVIPADWPDGVFDLVVLSEVLYFMAPADVARTARRVVGSLAPSGRVLLVNWLGRTGTCCDGDAAVNIFIQACGDTLVPVVVRRNPSYRLDLLEPGRSCGVTSQ